MVQAKWTLWVKAQSSPTTFCANHRYTFWWEEEPRLKYALSEKWQCIQLPVWRCIDEFERHGGKISCLSKWDTNHRYYILPLPSTMHFDDLLHLLTLRYTYNSCLWSLHDSFTQCSSSQQFFSLYNALVFFIIFTKNSAILYYMYICLSICLHFL